MSGRIVITGMGIISSLGVGVGSTFEALTKGKSGVGHVEILPTAHTEMPVGEVRMTNEDLATELKVGYPANELRTVLLGITASKEAITDAELDLDLIRRTAFINGTTVGGMDKTERIFDEILQTEGLTEKSKELRFNDCGFTTDLIASCLGNFNMITTPSTACSSSANAIILGANMIKAGIVDFALVGGSEALSKFHLNGFNSLMVLDKELCRPFMDSRAGINLGEGAGYIVLEKEETALARGKRPIGVLCGYGNACDAFHQTATSPNGDGPYLAMRKALHIAGLRPEQIDYINAHGTGTMNNDETEMNAMQRIWGEKLPLFSSTKSFTGHTTSAAGVIEAVISLLCLSNDMVPRLPEDGNNMKSDKSGREKRAIKYVLDNSFGFGGNDTSLIFSKYDE